MGETQFEQFLREATTFDPSYERSLDGDPLFGLYTSWCHVSRTAPTTEASFWAAMNNQLQPGRNGLHMKGPAAADYILNSYPGLV